MPKVTNILRIDASARHKGSISRQLVDHVIDHLAQKGAVQVTNRDLSNGLPQIDETWVGANFTPIEARTSAQLAKLAMSDTLVSEIKSTNTIVIGLPVYNFGVPASLKAWIDLVARAGITFRYTDKGPVGLLEGKKAIIVLVSGGTKSGSDIDFATPYIRHVLGFLGISNITVIAADALGQDAEAKLSSARRLVSTL